MAKRLSRGKCSILTLFTKRKWYDHIAAGKKREEYRDITPYWTNRVDNWCNDHDGTNKKLIVGFAVPGSKADMFMELAYIGMHMDDVDASFPDWGEPNHPHYVFGLGDFVEIVK